MQNVIDMIKKELKNDAEHNESVENIQEQIVHLYELYNEEQRRAVNEVFIALIGYPLSVLIGEEKED